MKFLRKREVVALTGLSAITIWHHTRAGKFPRGVVLGPNNVRWVEEEVQSWMKDMAENGIRQVLKGDAAGTRPTIDPSSRGKKKKLRKPAQAAV